MATETAVTTAPDLRATLDAGVRVDALALPESDVARLRAEADRAASPRDELATAHIAGEGAATETARGPCARLELDSALVARLEQATVWKLRSGARDEIGIGCPELVVCDRVALAAEHLEIRERVRGFMFNEQHERADVVDGDVCRRAAWTDAPISFKREALLPHPTRPSIPRVSASPSGVTFSRPSTCIPEPLSEARSGAEPFLLLDKTFPALFTNPRGCLAHG